MGPWAGFWGSAGAVAHGRPATGGARDHASLSRDRKKKERERERGTSCMLRQESQNRRGSQGAICRSAVVRGGGVLTVVRSRGDGDNGGTKGGRRRGERGWLGASGNKNTGLVKFTRSSETSDSAVFLLLQDSSSGK